MSKCSGCGVKLDNDLKLCERCFRIQHYNEYQKVIKDNKDYYKIIDGIDDSLTVLIIDLLDIPFNLDELLSHLNDNVILVLTKYDLIPSNYDQKFIEYIHDQYHFNYLDCIVVSSKNNYHIDELYDLILKYNTNNKVYFVGYTNAGKSSIINKIIYNYSDINTVITTSNLPSTTLDTIEIKINDILFIDTPGIIQDSIINSIDNNNLKKLIPKKRIKPISYQIKTKQSIVIEDLFQIDCLNRNNIVIYVSNDLNIKRYYNDFKLNYNKQHIKVDSDSDIVIPGLGFIHVLNAAEFDIYVYDNIKCFKRKSIM